MTTVAIVPISVNGEKSYRAIAGDKHSVGKTAGQALDALTAQLDEIEFSIHESLLQGDRSTSSFPNHAG
jgi:hypothetical protein